MFCCGRSFEEVCGRLQCCLENLKEVVLVNSFPLKDGLIQLFSGAIQSVHVVRYLLVLRLHVAKFQFGVT